MAELHGEHQYKTPSGNRPNTIKLAHPFRLPSDPAKNPSGKFFGTADVSAAINGIIASSNVGPGTGNGNGNVAWSLPHSSMGNADSNVHSTISNQLGFKQSSVSTSTAVHPNKTNNLFVCNLNRFSPSDSSTPEPANLFSKSEKTASNGKTEPTNSLEWDSENPPIKKFLPPSSIRRASALSPRNLKRGTRGSPLALSIFNSENRNSRAAVGPKSAHTLPRAFLENMDLSSQQKKQPSQQMPLLPPTVSSASPLNTDFQPLLRPTGPFLSLQGEKENPSLELLKLTRADLRELSQHIKISGASQQASVHKIEALLGEIHKQQKETSGVLEKMLQLKVDKKNTVDFEGVVDGSLKFMAEIVSFLLFFLFPSLLISKV
ncbi:hypothetical protein BGW36DRAFT_193515 [Talaromyces proteolyticus]|uniref:Uncharacterized protein n=1 Tax=Talaromyces proteolyticus TaxID=1131652 RepID=A0AAD4KRJ5_9EURO|nr:uncharacterized protein BGW36DRAFT_193515 [Talaromyces proteolyticus]KAH8694937.1 hypothetical protein BGW36DRAFT_193515 [Talaromyces proteolyticus]